MPSPLRMNLKSREGTDDNALMKIRDIENVKNLDVLFIGSSHAYRSFDPRIWKKRGYKSFNLGTSSQTHIHTGLLLKEYIPLTTPKLIVYEVYPDIFTNSGLESNTIFLSYNICYDDMLDVVVRSKDIKNINEYIFATYRRWRYPNEDIPVIVDTLIERYMVDGFVERVDSDFKEISSFKRGNMIQQQVQAFRNNMDYLKSEDVEVILVHAPVTQIELDRFLDVKKYESLMSEYGGYFDFSNLKELNDSLHFYDFHHLNQKGVEVFNPIFIDTLLRLNLLKDTYK